MLTETQKPQEDKVFGTCFYGKWIEERNLSPIRCDAINGQLEVEALSLTFVSTTLTI